MLAENARRRVDFSGRCAAAVQDASLPTQRGDGQAAPLEDLWDEAIAALVRAVVHYDPSSGYRFSTYACNSVIRGCWRYAARSISQQRRGLGFRLDIDEAELVTPSAEDEASAREAARGMALAAAAKAGEPGGLVRELAGIHREDPGTRAVKRATAAKQCRLATEASPSEVGARRRTRVQA
jgi:hypothetical protein